MKLVSYLFTFSFSNVFFCSETASVVKYLACLPQVGMVCRSNQIKTLKLVFAASLLNIEKGDVV